MAPINGIIARDFNADGNLDLLMAGNMYHTEVETPRYDAGVGVCLMGDGKGGFTSQLPSHTGFYAPGDVEDMQLLSTAKAGEYLVIIANNGAPLQTFRVNLEPKKAL